MNKKMMITAVITTATSERGATRPKKVKRMKLFFFCRFH
jgi:hypothetical protein